MDSSAELQRMQSESLVKVERAHTAPGAGDNPFTNQTPRPGCAEWAKMILLLPLAIVRVMLILVFLLLATPFACMALCGYDPGPDPALPNTLSCWRKALFFPIRLATRGVLLCLGFWWISEKGERVPATEAPLLLPNHLGVVEPLYLMCRYGVSHVAKAETIDTPLVGTLARGMLQVFVRRSADDAPRIGTHSAQEVRDVIEKRARNMGANNFPQLCLYPEATCTNGRSVIAFKLGAFYPGVSVQPVAIRHDHRWFDPSLTEGTTFYLWRFLTQMYNNMSVEFLPVIHPTLEEQHNPKKFAARVRSAIAEALGVAETEHALADFFLAKTAAKSGTDQFAAIDTPLGELSKLLQLQPSDFTFYMQRFASADRNADGTIGFSEFEEALQTKPGNEYVKQLFEMFDQDGDGVLHYAEFVSGLLYINSKVDDAQAARLAFGMMDKNKDGKVYRADAEKAVEDYTIETFTQAQIIELFDKMDPERRGWIEESEAVQFVADNPEVMNNTRKTALLQRFAGVLVEERAAQRASRLGQ